MKRSALVISVWLGVVLSVVASGTAQADVTIEGKVDSIIVVAHGAERGNVIAIIAERFDMEVSGGLIQAGVVYGTFSGSLGAVLKSILSPNGYAIVYRDGRPTRVSILNHSPTRQNVGEAL